MALLEVRNISKSFGRTKVLADVSFDLEKGEALSVIGSSGNGKTTLLRCLNGLESVDEGTVVLNGETIIKDAGGGKGKTKNAPEHRFGFVFQSFNLFPQYTAAENVSLPLRIAEKRRLKAGQRSLLDGMTVDEKAKKLLDDVGLSDKRDNYPCELSGGQQQRVAIARALALKPEILCFDEPTSALDPELTGEVLKVIRTLKAEGVTMIVVTHEMEFARSLSDNVLFLSEGKIEEYGAPEQVFGAPKSEKLRSFLHII